jgi:hypothetical protein
MPLTFVADNVDYDSIKRLIKDHTTPGRGKAISIPGQSGEVESDFEDAFFRLLCEQHDRIGLFVKSKSGEIDRRLGKSIQLSVCNPNLTYSKII